MRIIGLLLAVGCSEFEIQEVVDDDTMQRGLLEADPGFVNFGALQPGEAVTQGVLVRSVGELPVTLQGGLIEGSGAFGLQWPGSGIRLEPGDTTEVFVQYTADSLDDDANLVLVSDAYEPRLTVPLDGTIISAALAASPSPREFYSGTGDPVVEEVRIESVGTATLELTGSLLLGDDFEIVQSPLPISLEPGDSTTIAIAYTPDPSGEGSEGELWLESNALSNPDLVPLVGDLQPPCLGLAEARDRGILDIYDPFGGNIILVNQDRGEDAHNICIDRWYIYLTEESQDAAAGDPFYDPGAEYPLGSIVLEPGEQLSLNYAELSQPTWWCVEETQVTRATDSFLFLGARVPPPLLDEMLNDNEPLSDVRQANIWGYQTLNPTPIVGRYTHYVEVSSTQSATVELTTLNMGSRDVVTTVVEQVPAEFEATGFSVPPDYTTTLDDGTVEYGFDVSLDARILTDIDIHTIYDEVRITYQLKVAKDAECIGRHQFPEMTATWQDSSARTHVSTGAPLVAICLSDNPE
ncbi:MAG: hypothetical protein AAFV53_12775 [Myxococcota bacterium]